MSWKIHLLGPLTVERAERDVPLDRLRKSERTLLAALALRRGHVVPKDELAEALFGHLDPARANANLRVAASRLRAALSDTALVESVEGGYRMTGDVAVDAEDFEARADAGRAAFAAGKIDGARAELEGALAAYRGDVLESETDSEWAEPLRARLRARHLDAMDDLADAYLGLARPRDAVAVLERAIAADRARESSYRRLMTAHYAAGEQDGALRAYERCRQALDQELGVDPLPETMSLHERIVRRELIAVPGTRTPVAERRGLPFVARGPERITLDAVIARAAQECVLALLVGEPGAGKTRLMEESLRARSDVAVFATRCYELERDLPFHPLRDALGDRAPTAGDDRGELIAAYARAVLARGQGRPLVWTIDDLQWADRSTLDVLHHLTRRLAEAHVAVIATGRADALPPEHLAMRLLTDLRREGRGERVALAPFALDDVAALARASGIAADQAGAIHSRSGGNAFFVTELIGAMRRGVVTLPETARDAVLARTHSLPAQTRTALEAAAVLAGRFQVREVAEVASLDPEAARRAIGDLEALDLVRPLPPSDYAFAHDLVREAVYGDVPMAARREMHSRAIGAIEGARGENGVSLICYHAELADNHECAFACAVFDGERALAERAGTEAIANLDRALRHTDDLESRRRCLTLRADAKRQLGLLDAAEADTAAAAALR